MLTLLGPALVATGIDAGVSRRPVNALDWRWPCSPSSALADWAWSWGYTLVTGRTAERVLYGLRVKIFGHLQRLSLDYYDRELDGRIMTRMTTDVEALSQLVQTGLISGWWALFTCVGVFVFLVILSPPLALVTAAGPAPLVLATWWYRRRSAAAYALARDAIADVNANLQESLSGVRVAQAYVARGPQHQRASGRSTSRYLGHRLDAQRAVAVYFPFVLLLSDLAAASSSAPVPCSRPAGVVTAGVVIAFLLYLNQFFSPIQQLSQVLDTWQQATASVAKIEELLDTPEGTPAAGEPGARSAPAGRRAASTTCTSPTPDAAGAEALAGRRPPHRRRARRSPSWGRPVRASRPS